MTKINIGNKYNNIFILYMDYNFDLYIHSNLKNRIPALVSYYSFLNENPNLQIYIKNLEDCNLLYKCNNKLFIRNKTDCMLNINSSQSFFFVCFLCCEEHKIKLRNKKWILVIDPDIFCLKNIYKLNEFIEHAENINKTIICYNNLSSFMLINTEKINWTEQNIVQNIFELKEDAENYMGLSKYKSEILNIPEEFNSYDKLNAITICLHTSQTHTQPWKTGIKYFPSDLHNRIPNKLEKKDKIFEEHSNKEIIQTIFSLFKRARDNNFFTDKEIQEEIKRENIRPDIFNLI